MLTGDFPEALLKAIVGIEIPIDRLEGKFKMSQNKTIEDQRRVIAALTQSEGCNPQAVAQIMHTNLINQTEKER
jgi:transcriptional regulator